MYGHGEEMELVLQKPNIGKQCIKAGRPGQNITTHNIVFSVFCPSEKRRYCDQRAVARKKPCLWLPAIPGQVPMGGAFQEKTRTLKAGNAYLKASESPHQDNVYRTVPRRRALSPIFHVYALEGYLG